MENKRKKIKKLLKRILLWMAGSAAVFLLALLVAVFVYKEKIVAELVKLIEDDSGVHVTFEKIKISVTEHWPDISIQLKNFTVTNENKNAKKTPIFKSQILSLSVNAIKLLKREIVIDEISVTNGEAHLEKDNSGKTNFEFKHGTAYPDSINTSFLKIKIANLKNVKFNFYNYQKDKHIGFEFVKSKIRLKWFNGNIIAKIKGEIQMDELLFKRDKGPFMKNKRAGANLDCIYLQKQNCIFIDNSKLLIEEQNYNVKSLVYFGQPKQIVLRINAELKDFDKCITLLSAKIQKHLALIHIKKSVDVNALIVSKFGREQSPQLKIFFSGDNNSVTIGTVKVPYTNVSFRADLYCLPDSDGIPNMKEAKLLIRKIKGRIYDFPFNAEVTIFDFIRPYLNIAGNLKVKAKDIKFRPGRDFDLSGFCNIDIKYEGPATNLGEATFLKYPMKLKAQMNFDNFGYTTKTNRLPFSVNGMATVLNDSLKFTNLSLGTRGGNFKITGKAKGFTSYACNLSEGFSANVKAQADLFNLTPLIEHPHAEKKNNFKEVSTGMKNNAFNFVMLLRVKKLILRNLEAANAIADLQYFKDLITLNKLNFQSCNGNLTAKGTLSAYSKANADIEISNMDVRMLFDQCENFGQKTIVSENVLGTVSARAKVNVKFDGDFKLQPPGLNAEVLAELKNGHLINFESLKKISGYIFRKRDFKDVTFSEINSKFKIRGSAMQIDKTEIASNVLNFFVGGTYNFKDQSNLNFVIPWNNLKSRGKNYKTQKHQGDSTAKSLKLNVYGYPGKLKVRFGNKKDSALVKMD
jgi:hypothetical protein